MSEGKAGRSFGHGPRRALAIHCSLAHAGAWRGVGEALADELTLLAVDLPMHGRNLDLSGHGDIPAQATELALAQLSEPMDIIGHSFGAAIALRLAVEHPDLVRSVTLIEPVYFAAAALDNPAGVADYEAQNAPFEAALAAGDMMQAARLFNRAWGDGTKWDQIPEPTRQYMADRIHFVPASTAFIGHDSAGLLRAGMFERAAMPALLIEGSASPDMTDAINTSLMRRLPNAQRVVIDGAGHMVPLTHPAAVAGAIHTFLRNVPESCQSVRG